MCFLTQPQYLPHDQSPRSPRSREGLGHALRPEPLWLSFCRIWFNVSSGLDGLVSLSWLNVESLHMCPPCRLTMMGNKACAGWDKLPRYIK